MALEVAEDDDDGDDDDDALLVKQISPNPRIGGGVKNGYNQ